MKSTELYKIINSQIGVEVRKLSYKKTKSGMLGFYKKIGENYIVFWFQCSQDGFDKYAGSKFTVEFRIGYSNQIGHSGIGGGRVAKYLSTKDLDEILIIQNGIISNLIEPSNNYLRILGDNVENWYLQKFNKLSEALSNTSDIWFRCKTEEDVLKWTEFLKGRILNIIFELEKNVQNMKK